MTYYFPFRGTEATSTQNITFAQRATTASVPLSSTITALTASFATFSGSIPPAGTSGTNQTVQSCGPSTVSGSTGVQGPTGSVGADNLTCPTGTIECGGLFDSLSMALPGFPNGINFLRPSGSKFSKVCMEIPSGCTSATAECPPYLPTASITATYPSIP
jgi:hypothetical protein